MPVREPPRRVRPSSSVSGTPTPASVRAHRYGGAAAASAERPPAWRPSVAAIASICARARGRVSCRRSTPCVDHDVDEACAPRRRGARSSWSSAERAHGPGTRRRKLPAPGEAAGTVGAMEFRRINALPPYVFGDHGRAEDRGPASRRGRHRPRLRQPRHPVARRRGRRSSPRRCENPRNHRYSSSRGIPKLRLAITDLYRRKFGVELDPETQACTHHRRQGGLLAPDVGAARPRRRRARCRARRTRSTSGARSSPAPRCATCGSAPSRTSSPTCSRRGKTRGRGRG